ncbi:MAG: lecithin retinol acyltransferase family protein [Fimbriimonas sp.]
MAAGDQLRVYRGGYWHHGIDVGDGTVVHFKGKGDGWRAGVSRTDMKTFLLGSNLVERIPARHSPFPPQEIVNRALGMVGRQPYNIVLNNCESVAGFCQGLEPESPQVRAFGRRAVRDVQDRGPVKGGLTIALRLAGRIASLAVALTGRHKEARWVEHATDRHADREWITDRHELRWEPYQPPTPV